MRRTPTILSDTIHYLYLVVTAVRRPVHSSRAEAPYLRVAHSGVNRCGKVEGLEAGLRVVVDVSLQVSVMR